MKSKYLTTLLCLVAVSSAMAAWDGSTRTKPAKLPNDSNTFVITNEAEIAWFSAYLNGQVEESDSLANQFKTISTRYNDRLLLNAIVTADSLDMANFPIDPIGSSGSTNDAYVYRGKFDGQGVVISNWTVNGHYQNAGLFGSLGTPGEISNVSMVDFSIENRSTQNEWENPVSNGGIVGWQENGTIKNCFARGTITVTSANGALGGIVGFSTTGTIQNCLSEVNFNAIWDTDYDPEINDYIGIYIGGIAGYTTSTSINNCVYAGTSIENNTQGMSGAIVGNVNGNISVLNAFYDAEKFDSGVGSANNDSTESKFVGISDANRDSIANVLNNDPDAVWTMTAEGFSLNGTYEEMTYHITATTVGGTFTYDGEEHGAVVTITGVPEGFTVATALSNAKTALVEDTLKATCDELIILNAQGNDITRFFEVEYVDGFIKVNPKETKYGAVTFTEDQNGRTARIIASPGPDDNINIENDISANAVVFERTFPQNKMQTVMLPFTIDVTKVSGGNFYEFAQMVLEENGMYHAEVYQVDEGNLVAGTPYMFIATSEDGQMQFQLDEDEEVVFNTSNVISLRSGDWVYKGTFSYYIIDPTPNAYGFVGKEREGNAVGDFVQAFAKMMVRPMRACLMKEVPMENKPAVLVKAYATRQSSLDNSTPETIPVVIKDKEEKQEEQITAIGRMNVKTGEVQIDRWFDLKGRHLNAKPITQGTYFNNDHRVIVK